MQRQLETEECLTGGGEMGRLMRALDWYATPLGPVADWPQSLKTAVRIILGSRYPMFIWWGRELINLYNDGYLPMLGKRHPAALGQSAAVIWSEIWDTIGPQTDAVLYEGQATWNEERLLILERNGYPEEAYFTFSYSPIPGDSGGVGGIFCALTEDTQRVLAQRRMRTLRELSTQTIGARTVEQACQAATEALAQNPHDLPFALIYLLDNEGKTARLAGATGLENGSPASPPTIDLASANGQLACWPLDRVVATGRAELVDGLEARCGRLRCGVWSDPPQSAIVLPVMQSGQERLAGFLVAGISPRRVFDDDYRGFTDLLAGHIATAITNARAYEEERRRAEALAELDRAKTAFFSNVSHEFRTPLTLILGPVEDTLTENDGSLPPPQRERLEIVHRNGLRLQKLVNTLLDFSRIEAGRVQASYEPTDLATFTAELASNFRSACAKAGLELAVDCPSLPEPVYVDRDMWEKIVLNLLSNAFKFTLKGRIEVSLRQLDGQAELAVRDTGTGIPAEEIPRLFERFHRVEGSQGRTQEGSGIGLALVRELVKLHGGEVRAESELGKGSIFTVALPLGKAHLPPDRISAGRTLASTALGAAPYIEEALRWLPDSPRTKRTQPVLLNGPNDDSRARSEAEGKGCRILLADDNADMRDYVRHLLAERYDVQTVADGQAAWVTAQERVPNLILADVMMPGLDGFGLLRQLRAEPRTREVPVILLSARAGEESRIEGLGAGADDYLIKPFSARELLARVQAHLDLAKLRRESQEAIRQSEEALRAVVETTPACIKVVAADGTLLDMNRAGLEMVEAECAEQVQGKSVYDLISEECRDAFRAFHERVCQGERGSLEFDIVGLRGTRRRMETHAAPLPGPDGGYRQLAITQDVTGRKRAEEALKQSEERFRSLCACSPVGIFTTDTAGRCTYTNPRCQAICGFSFHEALGEGWASWVHADDRQRVFAAWSEAARAGREYINVFRWKHRDGAVCWSRVRSSPMLSDQGRLLGHVGTVEDITEQKGSEAVLMGQKRVLELLVQGAPLPDVLDGLCQIIEGQSQEEIIATILLADEDGRRLRSVAGRRAPAEYAQAVDGTQVGPCAGSCGTAAYRREAVIVSDIASDPLWADYRDSALHHGLRACWSTPILSSQGKVLGIFAVYYDRPRQPAPQDVRLVDLLIRTASIAIERRRAEEALGKQNERLALLWEAAGVLLTTDEPDAMLRGLFTKIGDSLGLDVYFNFMVTEAGDALRLVSCAGIPDETARSLSRLEFGQAVCGTVAQHHKPIVATRIQESSEPMVQLVKGFGVRAYACNPLLAGGRLLGTLSFASRSRDHFEQEEIEFLETISQYVTVAYERLRLIQQLRDQDRRKDEFLATLAHELRNPLAPIRNGLQLLRLAGSNPATWNQARPMMERQVQQMVRLVDDLLDMSRISRNKLELRKEWVELAAVVRSAVETSRPLVEAAAHELTVSLPPEPVLLDADPIRLAQVFSNLLNNAAKYTERGGHIWLTAEQWDSEIVVRVRDTGIGIPADKLPHIFEIFVQVDRSLERSQGGLGIGLTLVQCLVRMHGGSVEAHSEGPGKGSEFIVRLPVVSVPQSQDAHSEEEAVAPQVRRRVLVVDDNRDSADSLAMMLKLVGHEVATAHDGLQAVEMVGAFQPDVVLLDLGMPKLNGYDAARRIRDKWGNNGLVLIALTGWGQEEDRRRTKEAGFNHHLVKPVDLDALQKLLAAARSGTR